MHASAEMFWLDVTHRARQKAGKGILAEGTAGFASHPALSDLEKSLGALGSHWVHWDGQELWNGPVQPPPQSRILIRTAIRASRTAQDHVHLEPGVLQGWKLHSLGGKTTAVSEHLAARKLKQGPDGISCVPFGSCALSGQQVRIRICPPHSPSAPWMQGWDPLSPPEGPASPTLSFSAPIPSSSSSWCLMNGTLDLEYFRLHSGK